MAQERRKWSEAQKLRIIQEAEQNGLTETLRKYNLSQSLFHRWRSFYNERRRHGSLGQITPKQLWYNYEKANFDSSGEADVGNAVKELAEYS